MRVARGPDREAAKQSDGVVATINHSTEKARVTFTETLTADDLVTAVEHTGYTAAVPAPPPGRGATVDPTSVLYHRLVLQALLSVPVIALAMVPA